MGRDLSQQVPGMGQEPSLGWSRLDDALAAPPCLAAHSDALAIALSCNLALQVATFVLVLAMARMKTKFGGSSLLPELAQQRRPLLDPIAAGAACVIPSGRRLPPVRDDESRRKSSYVRRHASRHRVAHPHGRPHRF
jgi:hypothetical protein